jgi:hypothetical protein
MFGITWFYKGPAYSRREAIGGILESQYMLERSISGSRRNFLSHPPQGTSPHLRFIFAERNSPRYLSQTFI